MTVSGQSQGFKGAGRRYRGKWRGDPKWQAFDALPRELRERLANAAFDWSIGGCFEQYVQLRKKRLDAVQIMVAAYRDADRQKAKADEFKVWGRVPDIGADLGLVGSTSPLQRALDRQASRQGRGAA